MPTISIYNRCNNNCVMCGALARSLKIKQGFDLSCLLERIVRFYKGEKVFLEDYRDVFSISGGEPTLSPHFITIVKKINDYFPGIRIVCFSNGRMFSYRDYAKEFLRLNANLELVVSVHGHNAEIHEQVTRVIGSFSQTIRGIKNICQLKKPHHLVEIRVVIHRLNYNFLTEITKFIKKEFPHINRLVYVFFEIEGRACKNIKKLRLTYTQLSPFITKIYGLIRYFPDVRFYHFPLCIIPAKFFPYIWRTLPSHEVTFLKTCKRCNLKKLCLGLHKGYLKYIGLAEFKPVINNFNIQESNIWQHPIEKIKGID